jgi:hypothetical protein
MGAEVAFGFIIQIFVQQSERTMNESVSATTIQMLGAGGFGALIGWYLYYINRYRKADVQLTDLVTVVGILGGGGILALFPARTDLFGAYGVGLACGYFIYFFVLIILVAISKNFESDWFLDGRRKKPEDPYYIPGEVQTQHPMAAPPSHPGVNG